MANATMRKFGFPDTLVREWDHWAVLLRPAQVTLGSLILASTSEATAFSDLSGAAFAELHAVIPAIEGALRRFCDYERINYLMLMMVDPNVHFHVIPRYSDARSRENVEFLDHGWPGPPNLKLVVNLEPKQMKSLLSDLKALF